MWLLVAKDTHEIKKKKENSSITFQLEKDNIVYLMETNLTISNLI